MNLPPIALPSFTMTLPVSGASVKFRPYVVKEEKLLIMASESDKIEDMVQTMTDVVEACTDGVLTRSGTGMADMQYAFLQIRGKSIGEKIETKFVCGAHHHTSNHVIHIDEFTCVPPVTTPEASISLGDGITVQLTYPTFAQYLHLISDDRVDAIYEAISQCITSVTTHDEVMKREDIGPADLLTFLDQMLPDQFSRLMKFFETVPKLIYTTTFVCPTCGEKTEITLDGILDFFQ